MKITIVSTCVFALADTVLGLVAVIQTDRNKMLTCRDLKLTELLDSGNITEAAFYFDIPETIAFSDADLIAKILEIFNGLILAKRPKTEYDGFVPRHKNNNQNLRLCFIRQRNRIRRAILRGE